VRDLVSIGNAANLQFEISPGPLLLDRILLAGGRAGDGQLRLWEHGNSVLRNSILYSNYRGSGTTALYNLRWFGRTDPHAAQSKIVAGTNVAQNNVFVAGPNVPFFGLIDDIRGPEWSGREPMTYRGRDNVFFPAIQDRWTKDDARTGELAARAISVAAWRQPGTYTEVAPRVLDPRLRDPARHDYRFDRTSPLNAERARYPQYRMDEGTRRAWEWFTQWSGYRPDEWNTPPEE
jgi:hypothetical protein